MIVADTGVWIDYFNGIDNTHTDLLDQKLDDDLVAIGDLILVKILQGFKNDKEYKLAKKTLLLLEQRDLLGNENALIAADNYRILRKKGISIRKTNDVMIASYCITHKLPLLFNGKDFQPFAQHLKLISALSKT
jgi:hypothetical protein